MDQNVARETYQYDPDKERMFVRELSGGYALKDEMARLRARIAKIAYGPQHCSRLRAISCRGTTRIIANIGK